MQGVDRAEPELGSPGQAQSICNLVLHLESRVWLLAARFLYTMLVVLADWEAPGKWGNDRLFQIDWGEVFSKVGG